MPVTLRAIPVVAYLLAGPPFLDRSKGRRQTKRDTKTDAGSGVISSGLKHRTMMLKMVQVRIATGVTRVI